jgi:hypothetical protein
MSVSSTKKAYVSKTEKRENMKIEGTKPCSSALLYQRNYAL